MKRFIYIIPLLLLPIHSRAVEISLPEYIIINEPFRLELDSDFQNSKAPDWLSEDWVIDGYMYFLADWGYNGMRNPPTVDTTIWHLILLYDGGICARSAIGVVNIHGHWLVLKESLVTSGFFEPTGKKCKVNACDDEWCECQYDDVPALIKYDMKPIPGVSTNDFCLIGKPILAELAGEDTIYTEADVMPSILLGEDSLQRFIDSKRNLLLEEGQASDGTYEVEVSVVIEKDGSIWYTRVINSCGEGWIDKKAERVIESFFNIYNRTLPPPCTPGSIKGEPVRVRIFRTVVFSRPLDIVSHP